MIDNEIKKNNLLNTLREKSMKEMITLVGIGGAGNNILNKLYESGIGVPSSGKDTAAIKLIAINTDEQALEVSPIDPENKILIYSPYEEKGIGAGANPEIARLASEYCMQNILDKIGDAKMVFLVAGMGKGTGQGAIKPIAEAIRKNSEKKEKARVFPDNEEMREFYEKRESENHTLVVAVTTTPFEYEGRMRMKIARQGIDELKEFVDIIIVIPNENLFEYSDSRSPFQTSIRCTDDMLFNVVNGLTQLICEPGLINVDFADLRTIMLNGGYALVGYAKTNNENPDMKDLVERAVTHPLMDKRFPVKMANAFLVQISAHSKISMGEVGDIVAAAQNEIKNVDAKVIIGINIKENIPDSEVSVLIIATGLSENTTLEKTTQNITSFNKKIVEKEEEEQKKPAVLEKHTNSPVEKKQGFWKRIGEFIS